MGSGTVGSPHWSSTLGPQGPRHGCFILILEALRPERGLRGQVAKPSHVAVTDTEHPFPAPSQLTTLSYLFHSSSGSVLPLVHSCTRYSFS